MPTKWTNQLSKPQHDMLLLLADRREEASGFKLLLNNRCQAGIINPYVRELRTVNALVERGLVRWVWAQKDQVPVNGITLTQLGADTLSPPAKVTWAQNVQAPEDGHNSAGHNWKNPLDASDV